MALNLIDMPIQQGGWFKPSEEMKAYPAFLVEVLDWEAQRPGNYGPKDSALVNLTIFKDQSALDGESEPEVIEGTRIEYTALSRDLKPIVGGATIVALDQSKPKAGQKPAWIWVQVDTAVKKKVAAYIEALDAAVEAALADAPSFD